MRSKRKHNNIIEQREIKKKLRSVCGMHPIQLQLLHFELGVAPVFAGSSPAASAISGVRLKQLGDLQQPSFLISKVKTLCRRKKGSPLHTYNLFLLEGGC